MGAATISTTKPTLLGLTQIGCIIFILVFNNCIQPIFGGEVIELHATGSTFPSKCITTIMDQFMDRAKLPTRLTYRAVGSGTATKEFADGILNYEKYDYNPNFVDFAVSDTPLDSDTYKSIAIEKNEKVYQIPFLLSTVQVLHSIPKEIKITDEDNGVTTITTISQSPVKLSPCVLARIMKRNITSWNDTAILDLNPSLNYTGSIVVARRRLGSVTTRVLTSVSIVTEARRIVCECH